MWVAKIKFSEKGTLIGSKAIKYKVNVFGFPLSYYYENEWIIVHITGTIVGKPENIKKFANELKKEKRSYVSTFTGLETDKRYKKPLYQLTINYISDVLQKLRVAKQCFPYVPFANANEIEKMWPKFSKIKIEKIFSNEEIMEKLRPVAYMIFITAVQRKERGFNYTEPILENIGKRVKEIDLVKIPIAEEVIIATFK